MNSLIDREMFLCPICCEEYESNDLRPISISCGHTFCKKCIITLCKVNKLTCPIDKRVTLFLHNEKREKKFIVNKTFEKLLRVCLLTPISVRIFSCLEFKFCKDCRLFVSNYVFQSHKCAGHNLIQMSHFDHDGNYFLKNNLKSLYLEFLILHYFMNTACILPIRIENNFHHYEENFSFVGQLWNEKNEGILSILSFENDDKTTKPMYVKGNFINKDKEIFQGVFHVEDKWKFKRGFGLLQDNKNKKNFFGIISISPDGKISLLHGVLVHESKIFFGKFEEEFTFPRFILKNGEKIDKQEMTVIRKDETGKKFKENSDENVFYVIDQNLISSGKWIYVNLNKQPIYYRLEYSLSENATVTRARVKYIHQGKEVIDEFVCDPMNKKENLENLMLSNCYFTLIKFSIQFFFHDNAIVISEDLIKENKMFYGYQIELKREFQNYMGNDEDVNHALRYVKDFNKIRTVNVANLFSFLDSFVNVVVNFFDLPCKYFDISFWEFESFSNKRTIRENFKRNKFAQEKQTNFENLKMSKIFQQKYENSTISDKEERKLKKNEEHCKCEIF